MVSKKHKIFKGIAVLAKIEIIWVVKFAFKLSLWFNSISQNFDNVM